MKEIHSHCIDLSSGKQFSGTLSVSETSIQLQLYGFDVHPHCNCDEPIFLHTQKNEIVSLYANTSLGTFHQGSQSHRSVAGESIVSEVAVIGNDRWQKEDRVKRVSFALPDADKLLADHQVIKKINSKEIPDYSDTLVFKIELSLLTISLRYDVTSYGGGYTRHSITPRFEIEFCEGKELTRYLEFVHKVTQFQSYCAGKFLSPCDIKISALSVLEQEEAFNRHEYSSDFSANYAWENVGDTSSSVNEFAFSYLSVRNEKQKALFKESLSAWLGQTEDWENAFT
jgi:hypothetical protein